MFNASGAARGWKSRKKAAQARPALADDGSCIRLRPQHRNHVWSLDFVGCHTHDGRRLRLMTLLDEFTRKCLAIRVFRRINAIGVIENLADAMLVEGTPD